MEEPRLDVAACLVRVRTGAEDAARALMVHLTPLAIKIVRSHLPRRTSEEDSMQAVFIKVFTRLSRARSTGAEPGAFNQARRTVRCAFPAFTRHQTSLAGLRVLCAFVVSKESFRFNQPNGWPGG